MSLHLRLHQALSFAVCMSLLCAVSPSRAVGADVGPGVSVPAAVLMAPDGRTLWERGGDDRRAMASTTKIMSALVVLERASLDDEVVVDATAVRVGESAAQLRAGDVFSVRELLEGMLVKSGNDAAQALARHVAGGEREFVGLMNARASDLGLAGTHYTNAHGLDEPDHFTTARDLAVLSRLAMANPEFRRIVGSRSARITTSRGEIELETSNTMLADYEGATGIKTGWTNRAGYCVVASAERQGVELIAVVLGARTEEARFEEAARLLDWGFEHYAVRRIASAEDSIGVVPVADYLDIAVGALVASDVVVPVFDLDGEIRREIALEPSLDAPVHSGDRIGTATYAQGGRLLAQVHLVASADVERPGPLERIWIALVRAWRSLVSDSGAARVPAARAI